MGGSVQARRRLLTATIVTTLALTRSHCATVIARNL
jgi:hypothetical protein